MDKYVVNYNVKKLAEKNPFEIFTPHNYLAFTSNVIQSSLTSLKSFSNLQMQNYSVATLKEYFFNGKLKVTHWDANKDAPSGILKEGDIRVSTSDSRLNELVSNTVLIMDCIANSEYVNRDNYSIEDKLLVGFKGKTIDFGLYQSGKELYFNFFDDDFKLIKTLKN